MRNELKPPSSQFPSVSNFPIPSPMPNSPQQNKKGNQYCLHNHIEEYTKSHKIPVALPSKLSYTSSKVKTISTPTLTPKGGKF